MKKVLLTFMMLLFAVTGVMRAQQLTVHDGTTTNGNIPVYGYYADAYNKCEMVYPADELGEMAGGMINSMTFYASQTSVNWGVNFQVSLAEVENATISAFAGPGTVVYEGSLSIAGGEMVVTFDTPYTYGGGNLLVCVYQTTKGSYITSTWYGETVTGASGSGYNYSALSSCTFGQKNFLPKTTFDYVAGGGGGTLTTTPDVLDLGNRPNGAWMAPYTFAINSSSLVTVNALDFSGNYFTYDAEVPANVYSGHPLEVALTTGTAEAGVVNSTLTVLYGENRDAIQFPVTAYAYDPVDGDVWENAISVTNFPYSANAPELIYKNYELPEATDGADAVYQVTFTDDVMFSAGTPGADAVTAIYPEDFNGEGGPMADNNYVYNGPTINPGPMSMWFSYSYTGNNTFFGTSAGGGMIFGYRITAAMLQELGLGNCAITTVEAAAREGSYYDLVIMKGGDTPDLDNMVYYQEFDNYEPFYFFDINLDEPQFLGDDENIWVMFYSDSPYAAYCGKQPVDAANGKIWYTTNLTSWYSNTTYTPVIYTRFLELPTGREVTVDLGSMKIRESQPAAGQIAEASGNVNGVAKAQLAQNNRGNRDVQTLIEEGFEGGSMPTGWTQDGDGNSVWYVGSGDYSASTGSATGTYNALITHATTGSVQYLVTPEMDLSNATSATVSCNYVNRSWAGDYDGFAICYRVNGGAWNELFVEPSYHSVWNNSGNIELTGLAANYQIGFRFTDNYGYGVGVDDVVVTADIDDTPTPPTPTATYQIADMYVPAGTYYVAVASTTENFQVDMMTTEVPAPEQAIVYAPYDGETNVQAPYLAEWSIGAYTTEMQVLVGTQYPPQTALIDWTDYLVESAFITELEPNQSYFMQVNERNAAGTTMGDIIAFTTPIDGVEGFAVENEELYPGDAAVFTWDANRSFQGYNLYCDGVKVNETVITENTYSVEDLAYNMSGYTFNVTAVYDAGESAYSEDIVVYMTGNGTVSGHVYDIDEEHPIANATIEFRGTDQYGEEQVIPATADENGAYTAEVLAGSFTPVLAMEGYAEVPGATQNIVFEGVYEDVDIFAHEYYYPLGNIIATEQTEENNVLVEWSWNPAELIIDFETGDFSQYDFTLPASYPWAITNTNAHEGTYAIKSTCEGIASGSSTIEATVEVPYDGKMGFWVKVSSETNYDKFHFYIDGVEQGAAISGNQPYAYKEYDVTEGTHTYKWEYAKDSSVNSNDDCAYVDDITLYRYVAPLPPVVGATEYNFDDGTLQGWTSLDADGDGNGWVSSTNPGIYHNAGVSLSGTGHNSSEAYVISGSYANQTGQALTPDNYLVSPQISAENGAQIQFWACAQDASYAAEHFGVAVSTTTATASAFTTIQEWTMTAKGVQGSTAEAVRDIRGTRQGTWYQYNVDLSSYAGQDIYVAIRHFNCTDMFILNVDDIMLATGGSKPARNDRSLVNFILYRRNNYGDTTTVTLNNNIASDVFEYLDEAWANLPFGEYQWGIQAAYDGYAPVPETRDVLFTDDFEDGALTNWTTVDADGDGDTWQNATPASYGIGDAHSGTNCASSWSWNNYSMDPDNWMVSPMVDGATTLQYYVATNTGYPDHYGVYASTTGTATSNFTLVFEETAGSKGTAGVKSSMTQSGTRDISAWAEKNITLPEGTKYVAFRHYNSYDMNYLFIDDVTISGSTTPTPPPAPVASGLSEILWSNVIDKDMESTVTFNVTLNNGQSPAGATIAMVGQEEYNGTIDENGTCEIVIRKGQYDLEVALDGYSTWTLTDEITDDEKTYDVTLNEVIAPVEDLYVSSTGWAKWAGNIAGTTPVIGEGSEFTEGFEEGIPSTWTAIDADGDGYNWARASVLMAGYSITPHSGEDMVTSQSYSSSAGALNPDNYLVTPQVTIVNGSTFSFWAAAQDASYPSEHFGVGVSDDGTNFTMVQEWTMTAKGGNGAKNERGMNAMGNYYQYTVDLSAYAGQKYIAIRHFNCTDWFYLDVDDVELSVGSKGDRAPLTYKVKIDGKYEGETVNPYFQHNVEGFEPGSTHVTEVLPIYTTGMAEWMSYEWVYTPCDEFTGITNLDAQVANMNTVNLTWTMPSGTPVPPTPGEGQWYFYGDDNQTTGVGAGGAFYWAVMFPAGTYEGNTVTKVANYGAHDDYYGTNGAFTGTVTIYNDGTTAPATAVGTMNITMPDTDQLVEFEFPTPITIDPTKNLWVVFYNSNSTDYVGSCCNDSGDPNGRWVSLDGSSWMDLATAGVSGYNWMIKVYVAEGAKGEVHEISVPQHACNNAGVLSAAPASGSRDMWDVVATLNATSGYQYGVATDGTNIYTSSWSSSSTSMFYKYDMEGNFIEEFNITGSGQIRDLTYDGEYFYGVANASTIYCLDLANHTLVSTISSAYGAMRGCTYDPERDGFWVIGNWSGDLTLVDRTGAIVQAGPAPTSASGLAYYKDPDGVEHVYCLNNGTNEVQDYNIATNTITASVFNLNTVTGVTGSTGGAHVGTYDGKTCLFADLQQSPQYIVVLELDANGTPVPPIPVEGILGAYVFRNGELVSSVDPAQTQNSFTDEVIDLEPGEYEYCVRVVYADYSMSCPVCETVTISMDCDPVTDFAAEYYWTNDEFGAHLTWTSPNENVSAYDIYVDGLLYEEDVPADATSMDYAMEVGSYVFGIVAKYPYCESEMATAFVEVTSVGENDVINNIYPNPTSGMVTIEAQGMNHITVANALGQVVYDADVDADMMQLNLGQYNSGLYLIRVNTESGVSVKRVTVVK